MERLLQLWNNNLIQMTDFRLTLGQTVILVLGIIAIGLVNILLQRFMKRNQWYSQMNHRLKRIISRSLSYLIWIIGIIVLLRLENVNTGDFFSYIVFKGEKLILTVQKIFFFVVILFVIRMIVLIVDYLMNQKISRENLDVGKGKSILQITKYLIWIFGILIAIGALGLKLTFFIASLSALLVGVGFGLQHIFNDFFSGVIILFDGSIKVNDVVQVGEVVGQVKDIGVRTTKVLNRDNIILIIPNSKLTTDNVINWSHLDEKSRFNVPVGVAYGSDVRLVEKLLLDCAGECDEIETTPPPFVRFEDFGESSLDFRLFFWTNNSFYVENTRSKLRFAIDQKFRENNITIPFPQRDLHILNDYTK